MARTATVTFEGKQLELPVIEGSEGELGMDIAQLRAKLGLITLDPGFDSTGSCKSAITFIDGEKGILRYRGIPIEQLAEQSNFIETAWLLIFGRLPGFAEARRFSRRLTDNAHLHEGFRHHFEGFPVDAPPMAMLSAMINTLACFHQEFLKLDNEEAFEEAAARLISKVRTIAAYSYRKSRGLPLIYPDPNLRYVANFLHMMYSTPYQQYIADPDVENALNLVLLLHADHEQNCSTSTVRLCGSSMVNLFGAISAGINALWGPLHGGANQAVIEMLAKIRDEGISARQFVERAKSKDDTSRLMGFGHRVYKNFDPRMKIIKKACDEVLTKLGVSSRLLEIAKELEEIALKDEYFVERKLYPNVDFYSGVIYNAIGTPENMFTALFAIGRLPGWIAQWAEMHRDPDFKIGRPRQIYVGETERHYVPIAKR